MASDNWVNASVTLNGVSFTPGQVMILTANGFNIHTSDPTVTTQTGIVDATLVADGSNATTVIHSQSATITTSVPGAATNETVRFKPGTVAGFGRVWTVAADGLTATATA